ncbi:MAG: hypothetical protein ACRBBW_12545 [Cellvibrionaceae bacterium]
MAFVNEMIPETDVVKFKIKEVDKKLRIGRTSSRQWVADRERAIFVRMVSMQCMHPEMTNERDISTWSINFDGHVIFFDLENIGRGRDDDGYMWNSWRLLGIEDGGRLSVDKDIFIGYVKEALTTFQFNYETFSDKFYLKFDAEGAVL